MIKVMTKKLLIVGWVAVCVLSALTAKTSDASALTGTRDDLTSIGLLDGMQQCYNKNVIIGSGIQRSAFTTRGVPGAIVNTSLDNEDYIYVPTRVGNTINDSAVSCAQVFAGYRQTSNSNSIKGLNSRFKSSKDPTFYGYVPDTTKNNAEIRDKTTSTVAFHLSVSDGSGENTISTSMTSDSLACSGKYEFVDRWIFSDYYQWSITECTGSAKLTYSENDKIFFEIRGEGSPFSLVAAGQYGPNTNDNQGIGGQYVYLSRNETSFNTESTMLKTPQGTSFQETLRNSDIPDYLEQDIKQAFSGVYSDPVVNVSIQETNAGDVLAGASENSFYKFAEGNKTYAAGIAGYSIAGSRDYAFNRTYTINGETYSASFAEWKAKYVYNLYFQYLLDIVESDEYNGKVTIRDCSNNKPDSKYYYKQGQNEWCTINITADGSAATSEMRAVVSGGHLKKGSFKDVLKWFKKESNYAGMAEVDYANYTPGAEEEDEDGDGVSESACQQASGSLSWIICPVMTTLNNATKGIYGYAIEPILQVNAKALRSDNSDSDGVYKAWTQFRNYANTIFAIILALVILSQLTGFGLSNYGIKKILPRLIMIIVLVNISFILCQLLVDISNLLGSVLNTTFSNWAKGISDEVAASGDNFFGGYIINGVMDVFLNIGAFALIGATVFGVAITWDAWLIPLILVLITFLIGVLFFFIILAIRQAGIFILIALAPVAIICYALPNTKSLFDKWYKMFMALLLAYPICGLMMGGGQFASALLFKVGVQTHAGFFMLLAAVVVSVAPFFLIPSVIRNSMGALGNIGAKLSNLGSKAGGFLGGAFMGSAVGDRIKRRAKARTDDREENRAYNAQTRQLRRDRRYLDRMQRRKENGGLTDRQQTRVGQVTGRMLAAEKDRNARSLQADKMFAAGGIQGLLSDRKAAQQRELEREEVAGALARYSNMAGAEGEPVDYSQVEAAVMKDAHGNDILDSDGNVVRDLDGKSREAEFNRQLSILDEHPEDAEALKNVRAWIQDFADQGEPGRAIIQRAFERRIRSGNLDGASVAAQALARDTKFLGNIKGADRGLFSMVNDLSSGNVRKVGADGVAHYRKQGTAKYTAQTLANADEGAVDRLLGSVRNGKMTAEELSSISSTAREALSNPNIQVKPEMEGRLRRLAMAGYAHGASSGATGSTVGSNAMANSSVANINGAASYIRSMNSGSKFDASANASNNAEYKMVQSMAQNAQTALKDDTKTYTQDQVKAMQDVIKAARDMGVKNDVNNTFDAVDPASIQIRGVEPRTLPTPPAGFTANGVWIGGGTGPTPAQEAAVQDYLREKIATEKYNSRHFGGSGSSGGTA